MSFQEYLTNAVGKISKDPAKALRIFDPRYLKHFYWSARFGSASDLHESRWKIGADVSTRNYKSYEEYRVHQASKLDNRSFRKKLEAQEDDQYKGFRARFAVAADLVGKSVVICLGARLGTEVRALRDMGHFAVGVDLNPGANNIYVLHGDFHKLAFADGTVDAVYTNVLDHAFDLEKVMKEISRILRPHGIALIEIIRGTEEGYLPQEFEAVAWKTAKGFAEKLSQLSKMELTSFLSNTDIGDPYWSQATLRKR